MINNLNLAGIELFSECEKCKDKRKIIYELENSLMNSDLHGSKKIGKFVASLKARVYQKIVFNRR